MTDWNGDGRINSMDTYDMMQDTSTRGNYSRGYSGSDAGVALLKALALPVLAVFVGSLYEPLGVVIGLIWAIKVICFPG